MGLKDEGLEHLDPSLLTTYRLRLEGESKSTRRCRRAEEGGTKGGRRKVWEEREEREERGV
eukprot:722255-Rhodomonas_salina.1